MDGIVDGAVGQDFGETFGVQHGVAIGPGREVRGGQRIVEFVVLERELCKLCREATLLSFEAGSGVVRHQVDHGIGPTGLAEVAGTIERGEPRACDGGGIADVVQPCGHHQRVSILRIDGGEEFGGADCDHRGAGPAVFERTHEGARGLHRKFDGVDGCTSHRQALPEHLPVLSQVNDLCAPARRMARSRSQVQTVITHPGPHERPACQRRRYDRRDQVLRAASPGGPMTDNAGDSHGPGGRRASAGWPVRPVPGRQLAVAEAAAVVLLWGLAGWSVVVLAVAVGAAIVLRLLRALLLPQRARERATVLVAPVVIVALAVQSTWWAVALTVGMLAAGLALSQRDPVRAVAAVLGVVLVMVGGIGLVVGAIAARAASDANYQAAGDTARAQMLPHRPQDAVVEFARLLARPDGDIPGCAMFTDAGKAAFARALHANDCTVAMRTARAQIIDPTRYAAIDTTSVNATQATADGTAEADGCSIQWKPTNALDTLLRGAPETRPRPGPPPGRLILSQVYNGRAWQIADYRIC